MTGRLKRLRSVAISSVSITESPLFLESYFDVIFALNRQTHPGEKRQVQLCKKYCTLLPKDFEENINALMKSISDGGSYKIVTAMVNNLDEILNDEFK